MHTRLLKRKLAFCKNKKLLGFAASIFLSVHSFATTWYVNDASTTGDVLTFAIGNNANPGTAALPFGSIPFAITAASAGDTIYVDAGTYNGDVTISKSLTLMGVKHGINAGPAANPVGRGTDETIITGGGIYYGQSVDNITVDGFYIDLGTGVRGIEARGLNSVIINNIVDGTVNTSIQQAGISTRANGPLRLHSYLIQHNNVKGCRNGYFIDGNLENPSEISFNYASGSSTAGFQIVASNGHSLLANVSENNAYGLLINKGGLHIQRNTFRTNAIAGIRMVGSPNLSNNDIQFNFIENNGAGIVLTDPDPSATNNQAHYNSITGNLININNSHAADFNATCNWYGTTIQPLIGLIINGSVTFVPFLSDGVDTDPQDGFQPVTTCIVLPVTLSSFTATARNYDVLLNWQTELEANSSHFIIERSTDGRNYAPIGQVAAKGYSDTRVNYSFTDNKPVVFDRPVFYRLRSVDRDNSYQYSKIVSVILKTSGSYVQLVYPNPAKAGSFLYSDLIASSAAKVSVSVVNAVGQVILEKQVTVNKGMNKINLRLPAASGVHYLVFRTAQDVQKIPVMIN
jgi:hypothetical protein